MKPTSLLLAASLALAAPMANAAVVFEDTFDADSAGVASYVTTTTLTNWTASLGNLDILGPAYGCTGCIDLDGSGSPFALTLNTNDAFNFVTGFTYTLELFLSGGTANDGLVVQVGSFGASFSGYSFPTVLSLIFAPAADFSSEISIFVQGTPDNFGPYLDRVLLTSTPSAVPLPASLPLLAFGLGGLALMRRRRQAA